LKIRVEDFGVLTISQENRSTSNKNTLEAVLRRRLTCLKRVQGAINLKFSENENKSTMQVLL